MKKDENQAMAMYAPESPTTQELIEAHPLDQEAELEIAMARGRVGDILTGRAAGLVANVGPCAMNDVEIITKEGLIIRRTTADTKGLVVVQRIPPWKPRTKAEDWHGMETTDPVTAHKTIIDQANAGVAISME